MLSKINPTETPSWKKLNHIFADKDFDLYSLFREDAERFKKFSIEKDHFIFDYSKNLIDKETFNALLNLAKDCQLTEAIDKMFSGDEINETEKRAVLHTALRDFSDDEIIVDGESIKPKIKAVLDRIKNFSNKVITGEHKGFTGKPITDVVNIGIGGSDLGPKMVCEALQQYKTRLNTHFISNVDSAHLLETLDDLNPETTLCIIASKTFTTIETMTNAQSAKEWFLKKGTEKDISQHFVALSTNKEKVNTFGISDDFTFEFWDWVGGRYSLWSAIGLSISLSIGFDNFKQLLEGAHNADKHFKNTDFSTNIPVIMALLGIWYRNFYASTSYAILPYSEYLKDFPAYLQQADMESNGKCVDRNGNFVEYETGAVIWGEPGTNGQHAFYQLIHQGTDMIPADFIGFVKMPKYIQNHSDILLANCFAQTEALAFGKTQEEVKEEHQNLSETELDFIVNHKTFVGNSPTNTFLFKELNPFSLGQLIAFYEHKIFVQGVIWNVFSFDQFGVELGKILAKNILNEIDNENTIKAHDSSTNALINYYKENRN